MADVLPGDPNAEGCEYDLNGLAEAWDKDAEIRHSTVARKSLLAWPNPKLAGRINYDTLQLNVKVVDVVVDLWCPKQQPAKTVGLDHMKFQAEITVKKQSRDAQMCFQLKGFYFCPSHLSRALCR